MNRSRLRLALDPSVLMLAAVLWLGRGGDTAKSQTLQEYVGYYGNGVIHYDLWYYIDTNDNFIQQGPYSAFYEDGTRQVGGQFGNNHRQGLWLSWWPNGTKSSQGNFTNDLYDGQWSYWTSDGTLVSQQSYLAGVTNGLWSMWDGSGHLENEKQYAMNLLIWETDYGYYLSGPLLSKNHTEWADGNILLTAVTYYTNGIMSSCETYKNGLPDGAWRTYYDSGALSEEINYVDGLRDGLDQQWYASGAMRSKVTYKSGNLKGAAMTWYPSGQLGSIAFYDDQGRLNGVATSWDAQGQPLSIVPYVNGRVQGVVQAWVDVSNEWDGAQICYSAGPEDNGCVYGLWTYSVRYLRDGRVSWSHQDLGPDLNYPEPAAYPKPTGGTRLVCGSVSEKGTGYPLPGATVTADGVVVTADGNGYYRAEIASSDFSAPVDVAVTLDGYSHAVKQADLYSSLFATVNFSLQSLAAITSNVPVITSVRSPYGHFFVDGVPLRNVYTVAVDWNGSQPGSLVVNRNGQISSVTALASGGDFAVDMGKDFIPSVDPGFNLLTIVAQNSQGGLSSPWPIRPTVAPRPAWLRFLAPTFTLIPGLEFDAAYSVSGAFPEPPWSVSLKSMMPDWIWNTWKTIPIIGGDYALLQTQLSMGAEYKTDNTGSVFLGGQSGIVAADKSVLGKFKGTGKIAYKPGSGLVWSAKEVNLTIEGRVERELGIVDLVPAIAAAAQLPVVGRVIVLWTGAARVKTFTTVGGGSTFVVDSTNDFPWVSSFQPEIQVGVGITLSANIIHGIESELTGSGSAKIIWASKSGFDLHLDKAESELSVKVGVAVKSFKREFESKVTFAYPTAAGSATGLSLLSAESQGNMSASAAEVHGFAPISRDFLARGTYSRFAAQRSGARSMALSAAAAENRLIQNVYPYAQPSLAVQDGKAAIAFVYSNPTNASLQDTDIGLVWFDGTNYSPPVYVEANTKAEYSPSIAFDASNRVICAWERVKDDAFTSTNLEDMLPRLEIVCAAFDPVTGTWTAPQALTDNDCLDQAPMLCRGLNGNILLAWQSNPGSEIIGTTNSPTWLHYAKWDAATGAFGPVGTLSNALTNVWDISLAYDGTEATLVYAQDGDGDLATPDDVELFTQHYDGTNWSAAVQLTSNGVADVCPRVVYRAAGMPDLLWLQGTNLMRLSSGLSGTAGIVAPGGGSFTFSDFQLVSDPQGRLLLSWQDADTQGPDLFYRVYDPAHDAWSLPLRLTHDSLVEKAAVSAFDTGGTLHMAYIKKDVAQDLTDLYHTTYTLRTDLALATNALALSPSNPVPGQAVTLACQVGNAGDLPVAGAQVSFYLGDPANGGTLIGTGSVDKPLLQAGDTATAALDWSIPSDISVFQLTAVADAGSGVTESDLANNAATLSFLLPDLQTKQVWVDERGNGQVDITTRVRNNGAILATNIAIVFRADGVEFARTTIGGILPGMDAEITQTTWDGTIFTNMPTRLDAVVDPDNLILESDKGNNVASCDVVLTTDADHDGMPDQWERYYFGSTIHDGTADSDGDGMSDLVEYLSGTDPNAPASVLRAIALQPDGAGGMAVTWTAQPGVTYQVECAGGMTQSVWDAVGAPVTATNTAAQVSDTVPGGVATRDYRVRVVTTPLTP